MTTTELGTPAPAAEGTGSAAPRSTGRPRDAARETALLEATLGLLAEVGYDNLTIEAVAARAGAGKATVYRRWSSKADLVISAMLCAAGSEHGEIDTGSLRGDLRAHAARMVAKRDRGELASMFGMLSAVHHDADLALAFRTGFVAHRQQALQAVFERAQARGEIDSGADLDLLRDLLPALVFHRLLITGGVVDDDLADRLVHLVTSSTLPH